MLRICICDDDTRDILIIEEYIKEFFLTKAKKGQEQLFSVISFTDSGDLLNYNCPIDLLFLDIQLGEKNGLQVARLMREKMSDISIILISSSSDFLIDGYKVYPLRYLLKPIKQQWFDYEFDEILEIVTSKKKESYYTNEDECIHVDTILYIEVVKHYCNICTKDRDYIERITLKEIQCKLEGFRFLRPHKSFLVNYDYIKKLDKNSILLRNNFAIPLTRFYKSDFIKKYNEYEGK